MAQVSVVRQQATTEEILAHMERSRGELVAKKTSLEKKIAELEGRRTPKPTTDQILEGHGQK